MYRTIFFKILDDTVVFLDVLIISCKLFGFFGYFSSKKLKFEVRSNIILLTRTNRCFKKKCLKKLKTSREKK